MSCPALRYVSSEERFRDRPTPFSLGKTTGPSETPTPSPLFDPNPPTLRTVDTVSGIRSVGPSPSHIKGVTKVNLWDLPARIGDPFSSVPHLFAGPNLMCRSFSGPCPREQHLQRNRSVLAGRKDPLGPCTTSYTRNVQIFVFCSM